MVFGTYTMTGHPCEPDTTVENVTLSSYKQKRAAYRNDGWHWKSKSESKRQIRETYMLLETHQIVLTWTANLKEENSNGSESTE